jgi:hypothetical protein
MREKDKAMICGHAKELMAAYWQRELTVEDTALLRSHLETCPECSAEMSALGGLWERLADLPTPEPSPVLDSRWHETINALISSQPAPHPTPKWSFANFWPRNPAWGIALAAACLVIGVITGMNLPRQNSEIVKLREEVSSTREMVALSLLEQQSATERLRGVSYSGRLESMEPDVISALTHAVAFDTSVNVRLAAIDALSKASGRPEVLRSLTQSLPAQQSPMVQAAVIDYLVDARDHQAVGALREFATQPDLNPAVLERARYAVSQLSR